MTAPPLAIQQAGTSAGSTRLEEVAVIIPARNEETSISRVLNDLPQVGMVIVVDNGSTDSTATLASRHGARVVVEGRSGYGSACLRGLAELEHLVDTGFLPRPKIVVFLDGDYSDYPDQLPLLVNPIFSGQADLVLGTRLLGQRERGAMPPQSVYGNRLACWLMALIWKVRYTDLGPFRAINYDELCRLEMNDRNFGWTVEMQIKAALAGLEIVEVPVNYRKRIGKSKISGTFVGTVKAGAKILFTIAKYAWKTRDQVRHQPREQG